MIIIKIDSKYAGTTIVEEEDIEDNYISLTDDIILPTTGDDPFSKLFRYLKRHKNITARTLANSTYHVHKTGNAFSIRHNCKCWGCGLQVTKSLREALKKDEIYELDTMRKLVNGEN